METRVIISRRWEGSCKTLSSLADRKRENAAVQGIIFGITTWEGLSAVPPLAVSVGKQSGGLNFDGAREENDAMLLYRVISRDALLRALSNCSLSCDCVGEPFCLHFSENR